MRISRIKTRRLIWSATIPLMGAIAVTVASSTNSDARKAVPVKAGTMQQQQKPIKLRYYGGPKYPMYPG